MTQIKSNVFGMTGSNGVNLNNSLSKTKVATPSYVIFDQFIERTPDGQFDASRLLSRTCYDAWLSTRLSRPKKPEEAFRKAITCHCRGEDGMKPFPPNQEAAVLKTLRQKRLWPCFVGTGLKIGTRGLQIKGYWEERVLDSSGNGVISGEFKRPRRKSRKKRKLKGSNISEMSKSTGSTGTSTSTLNLSGSEVLYSKSNLFKHNEKMFGRSGSKPVLKVDYLLEAHEKLEAGMRSSPKRSKTKSKPILKPTAINQSILQNAQRSFNPPTANDLKQVLTEFIQNTEDKPIVSEAAKAILEFIPSHQIKMFANTLKSKGYETVIPSSVSLPDILNSKLNALFQREFILPPKEQCVFKANRIVGTYVADLSTWTIIQADKDCRTVYRGSIENVQSIALRVHKIHSLYTLPQTIAELKQKGETWLRSIEFRCDGTVMIVLKKYLLPDTTHNVVLCQIQDVTDDFQHLLHLL